METIEICEISQVKVNAKPGRNIWDVAKECIALADYLKVMVVLHFNGKVIDVFVDSRVTDIVEKIRINPKK